MLPVLVLYFQIDEPNGFGNTPLHVACYMGQEAVATELVNHGANVNQPNKCGYTPLHLAAVSTNGALCLELLVNNGADVNQQVWIAPGQPIWGPIKLLSLWTTILLPSPKSKILEPCRCFIIMGQPFCIYQLITINVSPLCPTGT